MSTKTLGVVGWGSERKKLGLSWNLVSSIPTLPTPWGACSNNSLAQSDPVAPGVTKKFNVPRRISNYDVVNPRYGQDQTIITQMLEAKVLLKVSGGSKICFCPHLFTSTEYFLSLVYVGSI